MRIAHDAVFEGLFRLHREEWMIIIEDRASSPEGKYKYTAQIQYSGRIVSQPQIDYRLGD